MERRNPIEDLAYQIYENSGRAEGRDLENWLEAERVVMIQEAGRLGNDSEWSLFYPLNSVQQR